MRDKSVEDKCIYVKLVYKDIDKVYAEFLKDKVEKRELTSFIRELLKVYFEDTSVRSVVDECIYANSPSNIINSKLTNILKERERLCSLLGNIQDSGGFDVHDTQEYKDVGVRKETTESDAANKDSVSVGLVGGLRQRKSEVESVAASDLSAFGLKTVADEVSSGGTEVDKEFMQLFESMV